MKKKYVFPVILLIALTLVGCGSDNGTEPPPDIDALYTAAAETLGAQFTQQAQDQPPATFTPTFEVPLVSPIPSPTDIGVIPTSTSTQVGAGAPPLFSACDVAEFVADISVPDGKEWPPGKVFTKIWEVKNIGTCTWNENYKIVFYFGQQMAAESIYQLTADDVASGGNLQISIEMTAPTQVGEYYSNWRFQNAAGETFGLGTNADAVYAQIKVVVVEETESPATEESTATTEAPTATTEAPTATTEAPTATTEAPTATTE